MKKKLLTLALAAIMVMGLSVTAFAADSPDASGNYVNEVSVGVTKNVTNGLGTAAEETFKFTVEETSVTNASDAVMEAHDEGDDSFWAIADFEITVAAEATSQSVDIRLPEYTSVGNYTYTIQETPGDTLGVTYDTSVYTMKVTVIQQGEDLVAVVSITSSDGVKQDDEGSGDSDFSFTNIYTASTLKVAKEISGNFADPTKDFTFTVTFTNGTSKDWKNAIDSASATPVEGQNNTYTFTLKGGQDLTFSNIPEGLTYTVTESNYTEDGYTTYVGSIADENKGNTATGTMTANGAEVTIINVKGAEPDTGINLDSLPYIMILGIVLLGAAYVISRRRLSDRY